MLVEIRTWAGMQPSANAKSLPAAAGVLVRNLELRYGDFRPLPSPAGFGGAVSPGNTLYRFQNTGTFITNPGIVNYVRGPIPNDALERTYYTGDGAPKVVDKTGSVRPLGVPKPTLAPVISAAAANGYIPVTSDADLAIKSAELLDIIRSCYPRGNLPYIGVTDQEIAGNFVMLPDTPAWSASLKIPGALNNGTFVPTNPLHFNLVSDRLGFRVASYAGTTIGRVDLELRGQKISIDYDLLATKLAAVVDPGDPAGSRPLYSVAQIALIKQALQDALGGPDAAFNSDRGRLLELVNRFITVSNSGSPTAMVNTAAMAAFYKRINVMLRIAMAVGQASTAVFAAMNTYNQAP